jgi:hypothetical protein
MATSFLAKVTGRAGTATEIPEPKLATFLFADTRLSLLWLIGRVSVGWQWISASIEKSRVRAGSGRGPGQPSRGSSEAPSPRRAVRTPTFKARTRQCSPT